MCKVSIFPLPMCRSFAGFNGVIIRGGDRTDCQEKGVYKEAASAFEARRTHTFRLTKDVKKRDGAQGADGHANLHCGQHWK